MPDGPQQQRPHRRLSTLMLLAIIVGLSMAVAMEYQRRIATEQRRRAAEELARANQALAEGVSRFLQDDAKGTMPAAPGR